MTTRRAFLQKSIAASSGFSSLTFAQDTRPGCGLAIGTYGLQSLKIDDAIRLVATTGYNAIEISAMPGTTAAPSVLTSEDRARLKSLIADSGLRLCGIMADLHPKRDDAEHQAQLTELLAVIQLGHDLSPDHPPVIQTVLGGKVWEEERELFRDRIADWVQIAADQRALLSIKPHRSHAMTVPAEANWLIEQVGSPKHLGLVYDYSHYAFHEPPLSIEATVATALPRVNYVAIKDAVMEDGKVRFALAGESDSWNHADIIRALSEGGYRGDFCCEVSAQIWKNNPAYDPIKATKICYKRMVAAFDRAGVTRR